MLKYASKFALDILPSLVATVIGAYIVNHYIVTKPGPDAPLAAAVSAVDPRKPDAKSSEPSADVASIPEPGVKAKGISERAILEKSAVERPAEKSADKPAETASIPAADSRRHQPALREKAVARAVPAPVSAPAVAAPATAPAVEAAAPEERRDANDLARAAIERLRGSNEVPRAPDAARAQETPRAVPAVQPLPPPIMVSTPPTEARPSTKSDVRSDSRTDDPLRPTPPADIPLSRPLDLRAEAGEPPVREHTTVAEDMLSAAKSVFHAVLPK